MAERLYPHGKPKFTHTAWYCLCPVYLDTSENPSTTRARRSWLHWWFRFNVWLYWRAYNRRFIPVFMPEWCIRKIHYRTDYRIGDHVRVLPWVDGPKCRKGQVSRTTPKGVLVHHDGKEPGPFGWGHNEVVMTWFEKFMRNYED